MSVAKIHTALTVRFAPPEHALFFEVANATGWARNRSADAIAMNLYPSRGLSIEGVEIKVDRGDWLRELKDPDKSAPIQAHCDKWWVAVSDAKIVKDGELPKTWGLLVLQGAKLVQKVPAPELAPPPISRAFVASLLRSATGNMIHRSEIDRLVEARGKEYAKQIGGDNAIREAAAYKRAHDQITETVRKFEEASGLSVFSAWEGENIRKAVDAIKAGLTKPTADRLAHEERAIEDSIRRLESARDAVKATRAALKVPTDGR